VNGARTGDVQPLRRGDVIRIGTEEFRFYEDAVIDAPVPEAPAPLSKAPSALATLEVVNEGASKGTRYPLRSPLVHVGRGRHNDIVLADDSISDSHAKIQRRESGWFVVDIESTNGTYVAGGRVKGEQALGSPAAVRFGGVKVIFRSEPEVVDADGGTRVIAALKAPARQRAPAARPIGATRQGQASDSTQAAQKISPLVWFAAAVVIGATVLLVIQDR
jgi:hypothetical protein